MNKISEQKETQKVSKPNIFSLLKSSRWTIFFLILFALLSSGVNLFIPKIISHGIDSFEKGNYVLKTIVTEFVAASIVIFLFTYLQSVLQTYASERVARDLRRKLSDKISQQSFAYIQQANPSKILTNLTSDIDSIKMFVSHAIVSVVSSIFVIIGASILLFTINWKLALPVIAIIPVIGGAFFIVLRKVRVLFKGSREVIDWLNKVINESILGAAIIRVVNSQHTEYNKFLDANTKARDIGFSILKLFATLIPIITFAANLATLTILALGGHFVLTGSMSLGDFAAFNSYLVILIFPIIIIGFMSNIIAQASASYERIATVLDAPDLAKKGSLIQSLSGNFEFKDINLVYDDKFVLKDVSFAVPKNSQTAIIGPTAAGKSLLLHLLIGLINPTKGAVEFDGISIDEYNKESFHRQVGFVFQDSVIFNMSIRDNIAFSDNVTEESFQKAIETSELLQFVESLPNKLDTIISERGTNLSGGQKQRIMLARALAMNPKILLLDDFTARVDRKTEQKILCNLQNNYPDLTLLSVTQKISSVKNFDQIILLMEGEIIAKGQHKELFDTCPEYVQIYNSQRSTNFYEV